MTVVVIVIMMVLMMVVGMVRWKRVVMTQM